MNITIDATEFLRGLRIADARVQRGARRGMAKMLAHLERLSKGLCPIRTGTLAATISGDPATIEIHGSAIEGRIVAGGGEAADYAIVQHERALHHTFPAEGVYPAKYVEQPLKSEARRAGETIAGEIRREP